jgi:predicted O-linked N-acetylglucosamine transferase (SPINDLY family)
VLHPPDTPEPFTETLVRLPCFYLQRPPAESPPIAVKAPRRDFALFVSANNPAKLSPETIAVWARILASVPRSRLQLKYLEAFADPGTREYVGGAFRHHGIAADRLIFSYGRTARADHLNMIGAGDVALDPFPFNGSTTTFEALWMGLPVVSLAGSCFVGRVGASLLAAVGLNEFVAPDEAAYVRIATELANGEARLFALRAELRSRVAASPLCNAEDYARSVERAYREMWRTWCMEGRDR